VQRGCSRAKIRSVHSRNNGRICSFIQDTERFPSQPKPVGATAPDVAAIAVSFSNRKSMSLRQGFSPNQFVIDFVPGSAAISSFHDPTEHHAQIAFGSFSSPQNHPASNARAACLRPACRRPTHRLTRPARLIENTGSSSYDRYGGQNAERPPPSAPGGQGSRSSTSPPPAPVCWTHIGSPSPLPASTTSNKLVLRDLLGRRIHSPAWKVPSEISSAPRPRRVNYLYQSVPILRRGR